MSLLSAAKFSVVARYAVRVNGLTDLAVTKLDVLDTIERLPICVGYKLGGAMLDDMPAGTDTLGRVEPVYETLDGWCRPTQGARRLADLPLGWIAWREDETSAWIREPRPG